MQVVMTTTQYRKRCFDKIEPTVAENKALTEEVTRLCQRLEATEGECTLQKTNMLNLSIEIDQKDREKTRK